MTIYICGAGPTGLSLAWLLGKHRDKKIVIIEKYKVAGGTWATKWVGPNKLFTHHSPQILSTSYVNTFKLWGEMGINYEDFTIPYLPRWVDVVLNRTSGWDKILLFLVGIFYVFSYKKYERVTVADQFKGKLSEEGWAMLSHICYLVDGVSPDIMTVGELYGLVNQTFFYFSLEMTKASDDEKGFATQWVNKLKKYDNISFQFNTELSRISDDGIYLNGKKIVLNSGDSVLMALDPLSLVKVLSKSDDSVKNNWGDWNKVSNHILKGTYVSISVQYHLDKNIVIPYSSRVGVETEWGIICISVPFLPVISCAVINQDAYSSFLKKKVRECTPGEIKIEVWRQLTFIIPELTTFKYVTLGQDVKWDETSGQWDFGLSSACRTVDGPLESRGKKNNLFILGPLNKRDYSATTMEAAVEAAVRFVDGDLVFPWTGTGVLMVLYGIIILVILLLYR